MSFLDEVRKTNWSEIEREIGSRSEAEVDAALRASTVNFDHFMSLLSPAAESRIEDMARRARQITLRRFGRTISLFAPLYLSNVCTNRCIYCGFNAGNPVSRLTLAPEHIRAEGEFIAKMGFRHVLIVSGEAPKVVPLEYFTGAADLLRPLFASISVEIYPMSAADYSALIDHGVDGLTIFQETYNEGLYTKFHHGGKKRDFAWRIEAPDRGGEAGFRRIGVGALLGLCDWRVEGFYMGLHSRYLMRKFWKSQVSISFPRLRPAAGEFQPPHPVSDLHFVQLLTALRMFLPDAGFTLSTRESADFRDNLIPLGVTSMSAGSRTDPGGYTMAGVGNGGAGAQFEISDHRDPDEVAEVIRRKGYEPVWKDWDPAFLE